MSTTWKAYNRDTEAFEVIKEPSARVFVDRSLKEQFRQEIRLVAALSHPNIVGLRHTEVSEPPWYYTMPFIEGEHVDRYCADNHLSIRDILDLFLKICQAVAVAHQHRVLHRDLKPNNILVDEDGEPHLLDFGLGAVLDASGSRPDDEPGIVMGAPGYMAPEQAAGLPGDTRTDVYGLGVVLYQLLTGRIPILPGESFRETCRRIREDAPAAPKELRSDLSYELSAVVLHALAKEPSDRYQTVREFEQDIECYLTTKPVSVIDYSWWRVLGKWVRRNRVKVALGAAGSAVVLILLASAIASDLKASKEWASAEALRRMMATTTGRWFLSRDNPVEASRILWKEHLTHESTRTRFALWEFYRRYPCLLSIPTTPLIDVEYSPSGHWLVAISKAGELIAFDAADGGEVYRGSNAASLARCMAFSNDGKQLFVGYDDGSVRFWMFDDTTGELAAQPHIELQTAEARINCIRVSPNGHWLAAGTGEGDDPREPSSGPGVWLWDAAADYQLSHHLTDQPVTVLGLDFSPDETLVAAAMANGDVEIWETDSGELRRGMRNNYSPTRTVRFSHDGLRLFSVSNHVVVWPLDGTSETRIKNVSNWGIRSMELAPGSQSDVLALGLGAGRVGLYEYSTQGLEPLEIHGYHDIIADTVDVSFSPDGKSVASVAADGLRVWGLTVREAIRLPFGSSNYDQSISLSATGTRATLGGTNEEGQPMLVSYLDHAGAPKLEWSWAVDNLVTQAVSPNGEWVAYSQWDAGGKEPNRIRVLTTQLPAKLVAEIRIAAERCIGISWLDSDTLMLQCASGKLKCWDFTVEDPWDLFAFDSACTHVARDATGTWLAASSEGSGSTLGSVALWRCTGRDSSAHDTPSAFEFQRQFPVDNYTWCVAFVESSKGEMLLATTGTSSAVSLWNPVSGASVGRLRGHRDSIFYCYALDERLLVTSSKDGTVRVWDTVEKEEVCVLHESRDQLPRIAVGNGRIAIIDGTTMEISDLRSLQDYLDSNRNFEKQRLANAGDAG